MKKHSMEEHHEDVTRMWFETHHYGSGPGWEQIVWFTAYERWLNDRPLMREENQTETEYAEVRVS